MFCRASLPADTYRKPRARWLALGGVLLLHAALLQLVNGGGGRNWHPESLVAGVTLIAPAATPAQEPAAAPPPRRERPHRQAAERPAPRLATRPAAPESAMPDWNLPPEQLAGIEAAAAGEDAFVGLQGAAARTATETSPQDSTLVLLDTDRMPLRVKPPPSADLKYDVRRVARDGNTVYGKGLIAWRNHGDSYEISGEAGVLFFTLLEFRSRGSLDERGVAPEAYSEKRFRRPETATHFHRERNTISFSASQRSYPRQGGEQDRASIVWQLAAIGRGSANMFVPQTEFEIFVAGVRDGERWRIQVIGEEEIESDGVRYTAWHVLRVPRPGSFDQKLDIWLAPQFDWYPVRIRYTENNGDILEMSVSNLKSIAAR